MAQQRGPLAINGIRALRAMLPVIARNAVEKVMQGAQDEAKRTTAFQNYTGRLRASIAGGIYATSPTQITGILTAGTDDAGTAPGWETPSRVYSAHVELGMAKRSPHPFIAPTMQLISSQGALGPAIRARIARLLATGVL